MAGTPERPRVWWSPEHGVLIDCEDHIETETHRYLYEVPDDAVELGPVGELLTLPMPDAIARLLQLRNEQGRHR